MKEINIYCDESCHLEHDKDSNFMAIGAVSCEKSYIKKINARLKEIKSLYGINPNSELKWTKISPSNSRAYSEVIRYFFDNENIKFRCLIINKSRIDYNKCGDHENFYYTMYYQLLNKIVYPVIINNIYLDIKDTRSKLKIKKLKQKLLFNCDYDPSRLKIKNFQVIRSNEVEIMQITDILIGALVYLNRGLKTNIGKLNVIEVIKEKCKIDLKKSTLPSESKFNLFYFNGSNNGLL